MGDIEDEDIQGLLGDVGGVEELRLDVVSEVLVPHVEGVDGKIRVREEVNSASGVLVDPIRGDESAVQVGAHALGDGLEEFMVDVGDVSAVVVEGGVFEVEEELVDDAGVVLLDGVVDGGVAAEGGEEVEVGDGHRVLLQLIGVFLGEGEELHHLVVVALEEVQDGAVVRQHREAQLLQVLLREHLHLQLPLLDHLHHRPAEVVVRHLPPEGPQDEVAVRTHVPVLEEPAHVADLLEEPVLPEHVQLQLPLDDVPPELQLVRQRHLRPQLVTEVLRVQHEPTQEGLLVVETRRDILQLHSRLLEPSRRDLLDLHHLLDPLRSQVH
mmetsp:Transcript_9029/g.8460  ORF Transcript_9029/g.8460 Transcript_9029/m.8460 type:complete len:325 (+) Transcript_9029:720-1694(+)